MTDFLPKNEITISKEFEKRGYLVKDITDIESLTKIRKIFINSIKKNISIKANSTQDLDILNFIHKNIKSNKLNNF